MAKKPGIDPKSLADFLGTVREFAKQVKVDVEIIANEQIRLMCRDAMTFTPPMPKGGGNGLSVAALKAGQNKTANDIRRIFVPQDSPVKGKSVLLRQVINAVKGDDRVSFLEIHQGVNDSKVRGLSPIMRKILDDTNWERAYAKAKNYLSKASINGSFRKIEGATKDYRSIHDRYKGAVNGRWPKGANLGGPQYFADSKQSLEAYILTRQQHVGRVKAGWAEALKQIPLIGRNYGAYNAPWVDRNINGTGFYSSSKSGKTVSTSVTNMIGNINNVSDEAGTVNIVYGNRVKQLKSAIQRRLDATIKRANRKK